MTGALITADNQVQVGPTLLLGPGTPYIVTSAGIEGWEDLPSFDTADTPMPASDGVFAGARFSSARIVTVPVSIHPDNDPLGRTGLQLLRALQLATRLHRDEQELTIRMLGETLTCGARINTRVSEALSTTWMCAGELELPLQFIASDPRRYSPTEVTALAVVPARSQGLMYTAVSSIDRLDWVTAGSVDVLDWGTEGTSGDLEAVNAGTESTPPVITIAGPCTKPSLTNAATGLVLEFDITLAASERLIVDTRQGSVLLDGTANRDYTVTPRSTLPEWFALVPGSNLLSFRPESGSDPAAVSVTWRSAYL
ncbi:phage distal tail protein [Embleya sp. NPDC001921]